MYAGERNTQNLCSAIKAQTGAETAIHPITKTGGKKLYQIAIGEGSTLTSPVIYMEEPLTGYRGHEDVLQGILAMYGKCKSLEKADCNFDAVRSHIHPRLVNYEKNMRFLEDTPHRRFFDLALIPVLILGECIGDRTFYALLNIQPGKWRTTADGLLQAACENGKNHCMVEALEFSAEELGYDIFSMSNGFHCSIIDRQALKRLAEETQNRHLYVIPVSIYETLIIPGDSVFDMAELEDFTQRMVESLDTEEAFLSNSIYKYVLETDAIEII